MSNLLERVRDGIELVRVEMELYELATDESPPAFHLATIGLLRDCEAALHEPAKPLIMSEIVERLEARRKQETWDFKGEYDANLVTLLKDCKAALSHQNDAPAAPQGDSTWSGWACQYPDSMPRVYGAREIAELNWYPCDGDRLLFLTSTLEIGIEEASGPDIQLTKEIPAPKTNRSDSSPSIGIREANEKGQHTVLHSADLSKLTGGHLSHDEVAAKVRMLMRSDLDHEAVCCMARDRIKWLAWRIECLEESTASNKAEANREQL